MRGTITYHQTSGRAHESRYTWALAVKQAADPVAETFATNAVQTAKVENDVTNKYQSTAAFLACAEQLGES